MIEEKYIWCRACNDLHHVNRFDKAPRYVLGAFQDAEVPSDDWRVFMNKHAGHRLEALESTGGSFSSGGGADPMRERYVEVTNGREWFVVRSFRKSIEEPLRFELTPGRLAPAGATVEMRQNEIRKEMKYHFPWAPSARPADEKIELFISCFEDLVKRLATEEIRLQGYDYRDGSAECGLLQGRHILALLDRCQPLFAAAELDELKRFVDAHKGVDGVLCLRVRHQYRIEELAK